MRRALILFIISISLVQIEVEPVEAQRCDCRCYPKICPGDAVIDTGRLIQFIKEYSQEVLIHIRFANIDLNQAAIQVNTYKTMYDKTIDRPLKDALSLLAIDRSAEQIINMVNSSVNGNSLLVANPEEFIKNAGLGSLQATFDRIDTGGQLYGDSILNSIIEEARRESGDAELLSLSQSSVPSMIQESACRDENLTQMAVYNVSQNGNVEYTQAQVQAEKQNLYGQICNGDPNSNPTVAQRLLVLNEQNPAAGSWDTWLAKTGGDNTFTRVNKVVEMVKRKAEEKKELALKELDQGKGIASEKVCTERDDMGHCTKDAVVNSGSTIRDAYSKAKTVSLDTAVKNFGTGVESGGLFEDMSDIFSFVGDAYRNISFVSNLFGNIGESPISDRDLERARQGGLSVINTPTASTTAPEQVYSEELLTATEKANILGNITPMINSHLAMFPDLITKTTSYLASINSYIQDVNNVKQCFDNIENHARTNRYTPPNGPYTLNDYDLQLPTSLPLQVNKLPPARSSASWYTTELNTETALRNQFITELNVTIPNTRNALNTILARLASAQRLSEIITIFNDYQNLLDSETFLPLGTNLVRDGEHTMYRYEVEQKKEDDFTYYNHPLAGETSFPSFFGIVTKYRDRCAMIDGRVRVEIYLRDNPDAYFDPSSPYYIGQQNQGVY